MLFDESDLGGKRKHAVLRVLPPIPTSKWRAPQNPPDLSNAVVLGIDTETFDPQLKTHGAGWARGVGHIVGVSIAAEDRQGDRKAWYFPLRHEVNPEQNLNPQAVMPWLKSVLETNIPKVGANITYDVGWLQQEGIYVKGYYHDVQFAEALLDETAKTALDNLAEKYLGQHKVTTLLYQWCKAAYGGSEKEQRGNIYRAPPSLVGLYAEADAYLPLQILREQWPLMASEELLTVYDLECRLIPLLIKMRFAGIQVNVEKAYELYDTFGTQVEEQYKELHRLTGVHGSVSSNFDVAKMFDAVGVEYMQTEKGNPSIKKDFLKSLDHPVATIINDIRELEKLRSTFLKGGIIESSINGKIYCTLHQLRSSNDEDGDAGTKTARYSSSMPNLQQVPSRSKLGKEIRSLFIPDIGDELIITGDVSQYEYRQLAHFAVGPGSDELRFKYNNDATTDFHNVVRDDIKRLTQKELPRPIVKNCNFCMLFGGGKSKVAKTANISLEEADEVFTCVHEGAPYIKATMTACMEEAAKFGYVKSILGRRIRFKLWEPAKYGRKGYPLPYDQALEAYGSDIKLAGLYKATNYKIQSSSTGEGIKMSMLKAYEAGLFEGEYLCRLQIHDELVFSLHEDSPASREHFKELTYVLENAIKLRVPIRYEWSKAKNWSLCK